MCGFDRTLDECVSNSRPPDKNAYLKINFLIFQRKHMLDTQKNRLNEKVLLSTQNKC